MTYWPGRIKELKRSPMPEETGQSERPAAWVNSRHVSTQLHPHTFAHPGAYREI